MGLKAAGTLRIINETQQISARFQKREFVVELADNPRYPQLVQFQLTGDRCANLDGLNVGDEVDLEFSLRGREWTSPKGDVKYFNSLDVWTIERVGASAGAGPGAGPAGAGGSSAAPGEDIPLPAEPDEQFTDDIPF
ncbi:MAG: DUF3127 domain-containing protein [Nannocystaceae bacterium]|nr:DUF3127 domain-containing protein [Nannocystaceae bacterium]